MKKVGSMFNPRREYTKFSEGRKSQGILDDYALRRNINTKEGTIQHTPTANKHIVNKEYVDTEISDAISERKQKVCIVPHESDDDNVIADGKVAFTVPADMNGLNLTAATCSVHTKGITNTLDIQIRRRRAGSDVDMLSTKITVGDEWFASDGVINGSNDDILTGDQIYIDIDAIHTGTAAKGCSVTLTFS